MSFSSRTELPVNNLPANGLFPQSTEQPQSVCTWSAHTPQSGPSPLPFPRSGHTLTATASSAPLGEVFLFGGYVNGCASRDLYVFSTRDFSTTLLQTSGASEEVPIPRAAHGAALIGTTLLICGGKTDFGDQFLLNHDSVYLLNLVSRVWTRVVINGPGPGRRCYHTTTVVGSKLFVFGGEIVSKVVNDMWALDLNSLKSPKLVWESFEPTPGSNKPRARTRHVSVTTGDRIIIFGGYGNQHSYNDTWSFDISTRKWTELQCTGSIPSPRASHAAVLVNDVVYVFGGVSMDEGHLDDLYALQLSTLRWFKFNNVGPSPRGRSAHAMASDGTRVFVLGGYSQGARADEISLIHIFDTKDIKYPEPERNALNPNEKLNQLARKSSTGAPIQEQPQHRKSTSLDAHGASRLQNPTLAVSGRPASLQIVHERNPGPNGQLLGHLGVNSKPGRVTVLEDDVSERSTENHTEFAESHSASEGEVTRSELERQLSVLLAAQTEWDQRVARLTDELALKSALLDQVLDQAEVNAAEEKRRARSELREHEDQLLTLVGQKDAELVDMQAKLDERDQQVEQYEEELSTVRAKLEEKESELETARLRLTDAEESLTKSKAEADTLRAQTAAGSVNRNEDQDGRGLLERMRTLENQVERASKGWSVKSIEDMRCNNEDEKI